MPDIQFLLNINDAIVQAPMLGITTPAMVAAASNAGILGSLPVGGLSPERTLELIKETKALTDKAFAVNLFAHLPADNVYDKQVQAMQNFLDKICAEFSIPYKSQDSSKFKFYYYEDLIQVLLDENIPVVSFTFGQLKNSVIATFKEKGTLLIGTATSIAEAKALANSGIDIITVQGIEAGGHRGTFLQEQPLPQISLFALLPQIADEVKVPLLAAGGIYNKRTIKAALALGASGVQVGSLFITADESAASEAYKTEILNAKDTSTALTTAFSGRWARGIENEFMRRMLNTGLDIPYYTIQNQLMAPIRTYAQKNNIKDFIALWAGQSAGKSRRGSTTDIVSYLISEFKAAIN
ncbi:nitronate monooxygenase [Mucilaginibacter limnophilus]|uniref:Nitronate monooxygenase n=1 Tax=Mucilaginibacter limnophilus TaxID=1932778 RepID=A0A3S2UL60_9SPHI|nr:nitronate monooxygenase [Mucilaginibacter limnophilus]RVU00411.1 nitronate monooxygenase [Mucilaginibacter limnophilus]